MKRRTPSLRVRLLIGLLAVTGVFLIVMGVVSSVVLGRLERDQFDSELELTAKESLSQVANAPGGYAAAYLTRSGQTGLLTPPSAAGQELEGLLSDLPSWGQGLAELRARNGQPFVVSLPGDPPLSAVGRGVTAAAAQAAGLPASGRAALIVVGRPLSTANDKTDALVLSELITGAALLTLLALAGSWLVGRGLAPLERMASTADIITSRGDLTARMPDPGDRQEMGRLAAAINTMLDRIQQAFSARLRSEQKVRQFAADASHELRTPLTTIRGYAELYRQGALGPEELPNAMRRIEQEADRMSSLVAELLELARLDRTSSLNLTQTDLAELVRDAVADAKAVEPGRPVRAVAPPSMVAVADEPRLRQVLANLLGNVRSHTPPGTPVTVQLSQAYGGALFEVADAGPGMSAEDAARAFYRFHRGSRTGTGSAAGGGGAGSGLGLSIVQAIAMAHGGHARLLSAPGAGTTVQVWVPVNVQGGYPERDVTSTLDSPTAPDGFATRP